MFMSTITKVLAGLTGVGVAATGISLYHDYKVGEIQEIPDQNMEDILCAKYPQAEDLPDGLTHFSMGETADEILNSAD